MPLNTMPRTGAIRTRVWRLIVRNGEDDVDGGLATGTDRSSVELFNLNRDPFSQGMFHDFSSYTDRRRARRRALWSG